MSESYYDDLAPYYKMIYPDWETSVERQASVLDGVIREFFGNRVRTILDAACGIGTQSIGLAQSGYTVTGSDISRAEIEKARSEVSHRGLDVDFKVADMRQLGRAHPKRFDLVIACDNAIPHLLSEDEISRAFQQFHDCTEPDGGCIISVRDYDELERGGKQLYPRLTHEIEGTRFVLFDLWEFDGDFYDLTTYVVEDIGQSPARTHVIKGGRYLCVSITTLESLLAEAGFSQITTVRERFFQPLIVARKDSST